MRQGDEPAGLLDLARDVALEAGALVRGRRRGDVEVAATKSNAIDVVTEADRASERLIYDRLTAARPGDGFLGEEGNSSEGTSGVTWVVDPIDGTVNFLYDIPQYAVSIAAQRGDEVVAAVVLDVAKGELFTATRGGGAFLGEERLAVRPVPPLAESLVLTGFNYDRGVRTAQARAMAVMLPEVRDIRRLGSAALDLCAIGAGRADAYVEEGLNPWDGAAGGLVATEAGARLATLPGAGGLDCVVCAPEQGFDRFVDLVRRAGLVREQKPLDPR
ncbi:MAG: inositol monophosphatase family protein [Nocardioides sp.]